MEIIRKPIILLFHSDYRAVKRAQALGAPSTIALHSTVPLTGWEVSVSSEWVSEEVSAGLQFCNVQHYRLTDHRY